MTSGTETLGGFQDSFIGRRGLGGAESRRRGVKIAIQVMQSQCRGILKMVCRRVSTEEAYYG